MVQRNMEKRDDSVLSAEPRGREGRAAPHESVHNVPARLEGEDSTATAAKGRQEASGDDVRQNQIDSAVVAPHKKLNTIKTKIEEEEDDDTKNFLSDEEIAWKLHQELNAGSPVLRTRSQRGGTKPRSSLAEQSLGDTSSKERQWEASGEATVGKKRQRGSHPEKAVEQHDTRKSPRAISSKKPSDEKVDDQSSGKGPSKTRSRKGKPQIAAEGVKQEHNSKLDKTRPAERRGKGIKALPKIPKLPMVRQGLHWYRARVLKEEEHKILVEFAGYEHSLPSTWLPKYSDRVWYGSYKGKDWRYHGEGAWVPKNGIQNRIIKAEDYGMNRQSVEDAGIETMGGVNADIKASTAGKKTPMVGTPNLLSDVASLNVDDVLPKRQKKSNNKETHTNKNHRLSRKGRARKKSNSEDNDSETKHISSKSADDSTKEDSEVGRRERPRRNTKPTALLNSQDFAVDDEVDMMDSDIQNGQHDPFVSYPKSVFVKQAWSVDKKGKHIGYDGLNDFLSSRDEQEALAALAEMPSSPVSLRGMGYSEAMLENSREALLEAYTNGNKFAQIGERKSARRQRKHSFRSEPDLRQSQAVASISIAEQMFGGLLHAISSRLGNGIHRSVSMPATTSPRNFGWMPHVWSSGVTPADAEPAIIQVPKSLIQKALLSPKHVDANSKRPPVPLFY